MTPDPHAGAEAGFTLIELMVAIILLAIVAVMMFAALGTLFGSSKRSQTRERALQVAVHATDTLQDDLRAARGRHRDSTHTRSIDYLRGVILFGETPAADPAVPGGIPDMIDVSVATPTELVFESDVLTERAGAAPVPECVRWYVNGNRELVREIRAWSFQCAGNGSGAPTTSLMMPSNQQPGVPAPQPFSYVMLHNTQPGLNANVDVDTTRCITTPPTAATLTPLQRNEITNVDIDVSSFIVTDTSATSVRGDQRLQSSIAIGSRQGHDYRFALGCTE